MFKLSDQLLEPAPWILLSFAAARVYRAIPIGSVRYDMMAEVYIKKTVIQVV